MSAGAAGVERRLLRQAGAARRFIWLSAALGFAETLLLVAQAWLIAYVVAEAFAGGQTVSTLRSALGVLLGVALARAVLAWAAELSAVRASAGAKSELRAELIARGAELAARGDERVRTGDLAVLTSRGIDALDGYFSLYLPHLILAVIAPAAIVVALLADDWISALIVGLTLPLIPVFMALVGAVTGERVDRELEALQRLAGHFLDVVSGLPTLKIFSRARAQLATIGRVSELYRTSTVATLRVTFLSSLILELLATISVAMVAVAIGIRLTGGGESFRAGLFALVLAPEAYAPLRRLAASWHASAEGLAAAKSAYAVIDVPSTSPPGHLAAPDPAEAPVVFEDVSFTYPSRAEPALTGASFELLPQEVLGMVGPSGCGKSTLVAILLGLLVPDAGSARVGEAEIASVDPAGWHRLIAWVPQRPRVFSGSLRENVALGLPAASDEEVRSALECAGLIDALGRLPEGLDTPLGEGGRGLSVGERRRLALARAIVRDASLIVLDEPTAGLDLATERAVVESLSEALRGSTVLLLTHRRAPLELCDRVVALGREAVPA